MSELGSDARDLIAQAREQRSELLGPSAEQRAQLREKLAPLWAAEASQPMAASARARWKLGSVAFLAGLGLLGWWSSLSRELGQSSSQLIAAERETAASAASHGVEARRMHSHADQAAARVSEAAQSCDPGFTLRAGLCAPDAADAPSQPLTAAGARKPKRVAPAPTEGAVVAHKPAPAAATRTEAKRPPATASAASAAPDSLVGLPHADEQPRAVRGSARQQPSASSRVPLKAAEARTPERAVDTDADPGPPSIDGELELLGAAQAALQKQRPSRALTLLQEHAFRFPTGAMVEERMAMQALALCALQRRHAAQTVLSNLEARGSHSPLLPRVRNQCGL